MKYNLAYCHSTTNYHVYEVESRDPKKNGCRVYIPRENHPTLPLMKTDIIMDDGLEFHAIVKKNRTRAIEKHS